MKALRAPIPGQSLTTQPKGFPWERPPEITDPEEALQMHLARLSQPEMLESLLTLIDLEDTDVQTLTNGILRGATAKGIHSIDVGLIAAPVIHEFIKQAATAAGLKPEDGFVDKTEQEKKKQSTISLRAKKMMASMGAKPKEVVKEIVEERKVEEPKKGLMARRDM